MRSEEIWHKVHVAASLVTIPFLLISIAILFIENWLTKSLLCIPVIILCIVSWNIVIKVMTNKSEKEYKEIERKDLDEQIKKESGWR